MKPKPFFEVLLNGKKMNMADKENYRLDVEFKQGDIVTLEGLTDWWVDPDFFAVDGEKITFVPISGRYRVTANLPHNWLRVEPPRATTWQHSNPMAAVRSG